jgi:ubiquinol-cytochrome c reductase cytochrome b subunit
MARVFYHGAYKAPREFNWVVGVILLTLTLLLSFTGYLLPWDQKGYGATKVATALMGLVPGVGPSLQKLVVGGTEYGNHTLTRFFALHAGLLPALMVGAVAAHVALFRRHGITAKQPLRRPEGRFWPDQVLMDGVACLAVMAAVLYLTLRHHGAELHAPADATQPFNAARPEWYFLFLFEFLKLEVLTSWFGHHGELVGAIIVPGAVLGLLAAMPVLGNWRLGHRFNIGFLVVLLLGSLGLTFRSLQSDASNASYQAAVQGANEASGRAVALIKANGGIPPAGAASLLRNDPATAGPRLFAQHCASCHRYDGHDGQGTVAAELPSAPDLKGFGSRSWLAGLVEPSKVTNHAYYGGTKFKDGKMVKYVVGKLPKRHASNPGALEAMIAAVSAEAGLPSQRDQDAADAALIEKGRSHVRETFGCTDCHAFRKPDDEASAPDLTGWGSRDWVVGVIADPTHARFYGSRNDRMPSFVKDGRLTDVEAGLLADWIRGDTDAKAVVQRAARR